MEPIVLMDVASLHPTPVVLTPAQAAKMLKPVRDEDFKITPKPVARPRKERSAPVRNPAFREHEGLKALQRELNSNKK